MPLLLTGQNLLPPSKAGDPHQEPKQVTPLLTLRTADPRIPLIVVSGNG